MRTETKLVEQSRPAPGVALLTLSLPEMRNAMTAEMTVAWDHAVAEIMEDAEVRAVVVTGAGSAFCSGADLSWLDQDRAQDHTPDQLRRRLLPFYRSWLSVREIAAELYLSMNTVRTHQRHLYDKLGAHRRLEAIDRARALGLLAPVPQRALADASPVPCHRRGH